MKKTIEHIAQLANVSKATVSRVINNSPKVTSKTRERVIKAIKETGYYPNVTARRLTTNKAETIGLIIPSPQDKTFGNPFYTEILRGFTHQAKIEGYDLLLFINEHQFNYSQLFHDRRVDGLLLVGVNRGDKGIIQLSENKFPYILTGKIDYEKANYVDAENRKGAYQAVTYLVNSGHKRIGYLGGSFDFVFNQERFEGYLQALKEHNLEYGKELTMESINTEESGYEAMRKLLEASSIPTAVFVANDLDAIGAMKAIKEKGLKIPEDIAVIGFDDIQLASYTEPTLTTVRQPIYEMGTTAISLLVQLIKGKKEGPLKIELPTQLIIRESSGKVKTKKKNI
ncbi:MAG TPA: LacI family transcriptional regulator [Candidatus Atribacteria bacterium]|nr:LacI family transcriptional regulator [Candidatus Atribacteria bacterium]